MIELAFGKHPAKPKIANLLNCLDRVALRVWGKCFGASTVRHLAIFAATLATPAGSVLRTKSFLIALIRVGGGSEIVCGGAVLLLISLAVVEK